MQVPLLIVGDCPSQSSGLARIARDIATILSAQPEWRVAVLGYGGTGSCRLPFHVYAMFPGEGGEASLPAVWDEWSQGRQGVVLTVWDLTRVLWLARPEYAPSGVREWVQGRRSTSPEHDGGFRLWSYVPIDSANVGGGLTGMAREALLGMDRVLAMSPWAEGVVRRTLGDDGARARGLSWMPHGLGRTWNVGGKDDRDRTGADDLEGGGDGGDHPADRGSVPARAAGAELVGVVATNQGRKDWGLVGAVCRGIADALPGTRFWWHVDQLVREWDVEGIARDYGLTDLVEITTPPMDDEELARRYRACSVTLHPGLGEGFGYPIFESLACGTPAIHGDYAGGASVMSTCGLAHWLVQPVAWRVDGVFGQVRPVYDPVDWVRVAMAWMGARVPEGTVEHLRWSALAPTWLKWFREGL